MTLANWDSCYNHAVRGILRRLNRIRKGLWDGDKTPLIDCLELLDSFEDDLFNNYYKTGGKFTLRFREFESLCNKYIKICRKENNTQGVYMFFDIFSDLLFCFRSSRNTYILNSYLHLCKDSTKEEQEYAQSKVQPTQFSLISDYTKILYFKKLKLFVYTPWDAAYIIDDKTGKVFEFQLVWDWWYPLYRYWYINRFNTSEE